MTDLRYIDGIGPLHEQRLGTIGITTVEALLQFGAGRAGRQQIAEATGVFASTVLGWVNRADLLRITGITNEYAELLMACGVDSVPELAQRSPVNLQRRMAAENERLKLVRRVPTESQIVTWVAQARTLPRVVSY